MDFYQVLLLLFMAWTALAATVRAFYARLDHKLRRERTEREADDDAR